jgi:hypothetical protein
MINENAHEIFMNDAMEEEYLQECEINFIIQTKSNQNPKSQEKTMKENIKKMHVQRIIWKSHGKNSLPNLEVTLCWVFLV